MEEKIAALRNMIKSSGRIVFLGGAGVSTESGLPDFRGENGVFSALKKYHEQPETLLSHDYFMRHTETFFEYYKSSLLATNVLPNKAHIALAKLEEIGKLTAVVTMNIDGLHQKAGSKNVFELHGSIYRNYCTKCGKSYDAEYIRSSDSIPRCDCGGVIKPDVVLYDEGLDESIVREAITHIMRADMLIIGGTSLVVYPAAGFVNYYRGDKLVLINKSATPYDNAADLLISESIGEVLSEAVKEIE